MGNRGRFALLSGAAVLALALLTGAALRAALPAAVTAEGEAEVPLLPGDGAQKLIALTFDDGPRRSTTTALLDGLAQRGAHATFFLIGAQVEGSEDLVRRMEAEGHQVGIHTYDHVALTGLNRADFDAQVGRTRDLLSGILDHSDFLLRPPYGMTDPSVKAWAGSPIIIWSIDPEDWRDQNTPREVEEVVSQARDGAIVLMHDIFPASVEAALQIVDQCLTGTAEHLRDAPGGPIQKFKGFFPRHRGSSLRRSAQQTVAKVSILYLRGAKNARDLHSAPRLRRSMGVFGTKTA